MKKRGKALPEEARARIERIFRGSEEERKGRAWVEREMSDPKYRPGSRVDDHTMHFHHDMIHEPEHGAELACWWNAKTKAWEPLEGWPDVLPMAADGGGEE